MTSFKLYSPSIVIGVCGLLLWFGVNGKGLVIGGAVALGVALYFHTVEEVDRHAH